MKLHFGKFCKSVCSRDNSDRMGIHNSYFTEMSAINQTLLLLCLNSYYEEEM